MNQNRKVMAYTKLIVEKQDNICTVKINNPEALNALNSTILKELDAAFTAISATGEWENKNTHWKHFYIV